MKHPVLFIGALATTLLSAAPVSATVIATSVVKFSHGESINVSAGDTFTVDLIGENFLNGPDGAAFSLSWNPGVLSYVGTAIANSPWDSSFISDGNAGAGVIDYVFLGKSVGNAGTNFALASFTFSVLGNQGESSALSLSIDPFNSGFVSPGALPINTSFIGSQVQVVPVPAAVWMFATGLAGLMGSRGLRKKHGLTV
ncbi:cohesin domain-containing protein [Methylomonas methanica]|uniref:Secreted protein n=1 Tax=Methylomonas methanica TaxID=421 RepID=A0A177MK15_METMH|nr:cohesin domain-containing protein [Methylomonas methanica]OAI06147.1 hypothetical protein A1332_01160 [Methylomonas methanica]